MAETDKIKIPMILGPTGIGKTAFAIKLAVKLGGEVVSMDSMQIYKHLNIGTAKPTPEERALCPHHLIDFVEPTADYSVYEYKNDAVRVIDEIISRGKIPVICGGTGLYAHSLIYEMDFNHQGRRLLKSGEATEEKISSLVSELEDRGVKLSNDDRGNYRRLSRMLEILNEQGELKHFEKTELKKSKYHFDIMILSRPREIVYERIEKRVDLMFETGLINEVKDLMSMGLSEVHQSMKAISYLDTIKIIKGEIGLEEAKDDIKQKTRNYAKRQVTWFKRYREARIISNY